MFDKHKRSLTSVNADTYLHRKQKAKEKRKEGKSGRDVLRVLISRCAHEQGSSLVCSGCRPGPWGPGRPRWGGAGWGAGPHWPSQEPASPRAPSLPPPSAAHGSSGSVQGPGGLFKYHTYIWKHWQYHMSILILWGHIIKPVCGWD